MKQPVFFFAALLVLASLFMPAALAGNDSDIEASGAAAGQSALPESSRLEDVTGSAAKDISAQCEVAGVNSNVRRALLDGDAVTRLTVGSMPLRLSCDEPMAQIYIVWEGPSPRWELTTTENGEEKTTPRGENHFPNEFVKLDSPQEALTINLLDKDNMICDIYVFTEGAVPDYVQQWQPSGVEADLLIFAAHAGDEFLCFGGAAPYYAAERGMSVQIAYMTSNWDNAERVRETLSALWAGGVKTYPVFSEYPEQFSDSVEDARGIYNEEDFIAFEVEQLRRFKPKVVVSHRIEGEYDDGVRALTAETVLAALEAASDELEFRDSAKKYGAWDTPKAYLHAYRENPITVSWPDASEALGGKTPIEAASYALSQHKSQLDRLRKNVEDSDDTRKYGLARTLVGPDARGNDFFENIDLYLEAEQETELETDTDIQPREDEAEPEQDALPEPDGAGYGNTPYYLGAAAVLFIAAAVLLQIKGDN